MTVEPFPDGINLLDNGCHVATLTRTQAGELAQALAAALSVPAPYIPRPPLWQRLRDWWLARFPSKAHAQSVEVGRAKALRMMGAGATWTEPK